MSQHPSHPLGLFSCTTPPAHPPSPPPSPCSETLIEHGPGGELVGVDYNGNRYFEKKGAQIGRDRWVVYGDGADWVHQNPSKVPPEWHAWLHFVSDANPANHEFQPPIYALEGKVQPTMTSGRYMPKGSWENPNRRSWKKVQAWSPPEGGKQFS